jgi:hypothetical protein
MLHKSIILSLFFALVLTVHANNQCSYACKDRDKCDNACGAVDQNNEYLMGVCHDNMCFCGFLNPRKD